MSEEHRSLTPPALPDDAHKGNAGRVLLLCGSREMPGAAVLAARGAIRGGAGLVTSACLDVNLLQVLPVAVPEVVLKDLSRLSDLPFLLQTGEFHAVVAGPGTGTGGRGAELARHLVHAGLTCPLVLDADALNNLADEPEAMRTHAGPLVLTPHPGEARRLLGADVPADRDGRVRCARDLSDRTGAIVCLKGAGTVVAHGRTVYVNETGNAGMATAGAGDVLAGVLGAYLALCSTGDHPDWTPFDAACSAVRAHGFAGDLAAAHLGQRALVASDLAAWLAAAQKRLEE